FYAAFVFAVFRSDEDAQNASRLLAAIPGILSAENARQNYTVPYPQPDDDLDFQLDDNFTGSDMRPRVIHITHLPQNYIRDELTVICNELDGFQSIQFYGKYCYASFVTHECAAIARFLLRHQTNLVVTFAKPKPLSTNPPPGLGFSSESFHFAEENDDKLPNASEIPFGAFSQAPESRLRLDAAPFHPTPVSTHSGSHRYTRIFSAVGTSSETGNRAYNFMESSRPTSLNGITAASVIPNFVNPVAPSFPFTAFNRLSATLLASNSSASLSPSAEDNEAFLADIADLVISDDVHWSRRTRSSTGHSVPRIASSGDSSSSELESQDDAMVPDEAIDVQSEPKEELHDLEALSIASFGFNKKPPRNAKPGATGNCDLDNFHPASTPHVSMQPQDSLMIDSTTIAPSPAPPRAWGWILGSSPPPAAKSYALDERVPSRVVARRLALTHGTSRGGHPYAKLALRGFSERFTAAVSSSSDSYFVRRIGKQGRGATKVRVKVIVCLRRM
ncbi:hypothetical protein BC830DRAFT_1175649, partial [Chytriomyces sp. MP71]